jgi:hypothetical protein
MFRVLSRWWIRYKTVRAKLTHLKRFSPLAQAVRAVWYAASETDRARLLSTLEDPKARLFLRLEIRSPEELRHLIETVSIRHESELVGPPVQEITQFYLDEARRLLMFEWEDRSVALEEALLRLREALTRVQNSSHEQ